MTRKNQNCQTGVGMIKQKGKPGRPPVPSKYTDEFLEELAVKLQIYIEEASIPFIKEFCYQNHIRGDEVSRSFYGRVQAFDDAIQRLRDKQEVQLVKSALGNKTNPAMAIFTLKNCSGWRDQKQEEETDKRLEEEIEFTGNISKDRMKAFLN